MVAAAPGLAASSAYRGNIWRLFPVQALLMFILWVPIWVVFLQRKGLSLTEIGLLEAGAWVLTAALEVPTGAIADRWGRKASMALGAFAYATAMFLILADALSPLFLLGYALWNSSSAFVSGADSALLYDGRRADGRAAEAAKLTGRYTAIQQGSQGIASLAGAALATVDITLCFTLCGIGALVASALALTMKEPPHTDDEGEVRLGYWRNLRAAIAIAARHPIVRALLLLSAMLLVVPLVVYYALLQPYALVVGLPIAWARPPRSASRRRRSQSRSCPSCSSGVLPTAAVGSPRSEEVEELRQPRELPRHEDQPHHDDQRASGKVQHADPAREGARRASRAADARGDHEEWHTETKGVREEQHRAGREIFV